MSITSISSTHTIPSVSARAEAMPSSPIRKLFPYAQAARQAGVHIYGLNIGQPDLPTPPLFFEAIQAAQIKVLDYAPSQGIESYRRKLVGYYEPFAAGLSPDDILVTCGGSEAIRFAFMTCLNPGDEVIVPEPFYANYLGFAVEAGVTLVPINTTVEQSFALPGPEAFSKVLSQKTKAILLCNPSNPTGKLYPKSDLLALRDICLERGLFLFSDEVYKEFCYDGETFFSALALEGLEQQAVVMDSVSKRYSACGARIGMLICRNKDVIAKALKFAQARLSPPTLGQIGAEALCDLPASYYQDVIDQYVRRRDYVLGRLSAMEGVICPKVSGAFYVMPRLPIDDADVFCQWLLETFRYNGQTVMLAPGPGFYVTPGAGKQEVRIAYVLKEAALAGAMDCLEQALLAYPGRRA